MCWFELGTILYGYFCTQNFGLLTQNTIINAKNNVCCLDFLHTGNKPLENQWHKIGSCGEDDWFGRWFPEAHARTRRRFVQSKAIDIQSKIWNECIEKSLRKHIDKKKWAWWVAQRKVWFGNCKQFGLLWPWTCPNAQHSIAYLDNNRPNPWHYSKYNWNTNRIFICCKRLGQQFLWSSYDCQWTTDQFC